jgi:hypothetical protein
MAKISFIMSKTPDHMLFLKDKFKMTKKKINVVGCLAVIPCGKKGKR